jgi:hypothetical protein
LAAGAKSAVRDQSRSHVKGNTIYPVSELPYCLRLPQHSRYAVLEQSSNNLIELIHRQFVAAFRVVYRNFAHHFLH